MGSDCFLSLLTEPSLGPAPCFHGSSWSPRPGTHLMCPHVSKKEDQLTNQDLTVRTFGFLKACSCL